MKKYALLFLLMNGSLYAHPHFKKLLPYALSSTPAIALGIYYYNDTSRRTPSHSPNNIISPFMHSSNNNTMRPFIHGLLWGVLPYMNLGIGVAYFMKDVLYDETWGCQETARFAGYCSGLTLYTPFVLKLLRHAK